MTAKATGTARRKKTKKADTSEDDPFAEDGEGRSGRFNGDPDGRESEDEDEEGDDGGVDPDEETAGRE